jgi:hypothetical protein
MLLNSLYKLRISSCAFSMVIVFPLTACAETYLLMRVNHTLTLFVGIRGLDINRVLEEGLDALVTGLDICREAIKMSGCFANSILEELCSVKIGWRVAACLQ